MPPALFTRSAHQTVPRSPAAPTGAAMPARMVSSPIFTGSAGTPFRAWARAAAGRAAAAAAAPAMVRNSRLLVVMGVLLLSSAIRFCSSDAIDWSAGQGPACERRARREPLELLRGDPARHREEAAVGHERQPLGGDRRE